MVSEIWCGQMGRQTDGLKKLRIELGAPPKNESSRKLLFKRQTHIFLLFFKKSEKVCNGCL